MAWPKDYKQYEGKPGQGSEKEWQKAFNQRIDPEEAARILAGEDQTPWQILGVPEGAPHSVVKKHFRELIVIWHPDRCELHKRTKEESTVMSQKIIAAYSYICDKMNYK